MKTLIAILNGFFAAAVISAVILGGALVFAPIAYAFNGTWVALAVALVGAAATALPCIGIISMFERRA